MVSASDHLSSLRLFLLLIDPYQNYCGWSSSQPFPGRETAPPCSPPSLSLSPTPPWTPPALLTLPRQPLHWGGVNFLASVGNTNQERICSCIWFFVIKISLDQVQLSHWPPPHPASDFPPLTRLSSTSGVKIWCLLSFSSRLSVLSIFTRERLVGALFSGWYTERRWIEAVERFFPLKNRGEISPHFFIVFIAGLKLTPFINPGIETALQLTLWRVKLSDKWIMLSGRMWPVAFFTFDKEGCNVSENKLVHNSGNLAKYCQKILSLDCPMWMMNAGKFSSLELVHFKIYCII